MSVKVFLGVELSPIEHCTQSNVVDDDGDDDVDNDRDYVMVLMDDDGDVDYANTTWVSVDTGSSPLRSSECEVGVIRKLTPRGT